MKKMLGWEIVGNMAADLLCQETEENIPMQYTGLKDKNGKEIYEGDILSLESWERHYQVKFIEGAFCMAFCGGEYDGEFAGDIHYIHHADRAQAKVIGNIYENLELLAQAHV